MNQISGTTSRLMDVSFTDVNTGTVVGEDGVILHTTDGGINWMHQTSGTTNYLFGVSVIDANIAIAVGDSGIILRTTDGGATWLRQTSGTRKKLIAVCFTDANTGTAIGENGTILRTTTGGVTWIGDPPKAPALFSLSQNYPNPFNPLTTIEFKLAKNSFTTLKVFNIFSREVATLVSEHLSPGSHHATWDATGFPSGIYIYRLEAGGVVEAKKLVLLK